MTERLKLFLWYFAEDGSYPDMDTVYVVAPDLAAARNIISTRQSVPYEREINDHNDDNYPDDYSYQLSLDLNNISYHHDGDPSINDVIMTDEPGKVIDLIPGSCWYTIYRYVEQDV
jgi:hypothetical protein